MTNDQKNKILELYDNIAYSAVDEDAHNKIVEYVGLNIISGEKWLSFEILITLGVEDLHHVSQEYDTYKTTELYEKIVSQTVVTDLLTELSYNFVINYLERFQYKIRDIQIDELLNEDN